MKISAYIGIGANLGETETTLVRALDLLHDAVDVDVVARSTLIETEPVGYLEQPRFLNGAARIETELMPRELLDVLMEIERALGRVRGGPRFGPRTIDLDLLLYGDEVVNEPGLTVPHPQLHVRRFVLEPLVELDPELVVPGRGRVIDLLSKLD